MLIPTCRRARQEGAVPEIAGILGYSPDTIGRIRSCDCFVYIGSVGKTGLTPRGYCFSGGAPDANELQLWDNGVLKGFRLSIRTFFRLFAHVQMLPILESGEETLVGGQAVMEGVMMRAPHSY